MNILLITLDQFRGDALSCAGHPLVKTPHLDALAAEGTRFARHYSQSAPCAPGRASLYTGLYQMNHRVVANGTPLDARFDNVALAARRAGYAPVLFGYTDQSVDPRETNGPHDPRLKGYEGILPGFDEGLHLPESAPTAWLAWLTSLGHALPEKAKDVLAQEPLRPAEHSITAFLTDRFLAWLGEQNNPWFAHLSHLRPHPPYAAAGHFSKMYDPDAVTLPLAPAEERHAAHDMLLRLPVFAAPADEAERRHMTAQYFGMVSEADFQLGRVWDALKASGRWNDTVIVVTSDHGEMLGDHGLKQKGGFFEQSYHIPAIVRDPRGTPGQVVTHFTEAVDIFPTLCEGMDIPVPAQCDGVPLTPFLKGETPSDWRRAAHWEFDWRGWFIPHVAPAASWERSQEKQNLAVIRDAETAYVHFGDGTSLCFDLARDPTWRSLTTDPARHLAMAERMLTWRAQHQDRTLTGMLVSNGGIGRWPEMPKGWGG
jgi:arylsulfatase A-like enzyme